VRLRVGLTGGIGSGKTVVGERFAERGALVIDADALARAALAPHSEGLRLVLTRWPQVRARGGGLDRAALAAVVFDDASARAALNDIVHPIVRRLGAEREASATADQIVVHVVPLLFETGFEGRCDATVLVTASRRARKARVVARSGLSPEEVDRRMAAQIDPALARKRATYTLENDGSLEDLRAATDRVWRQLLALPPPAS
jgi:dephospho-CoA kinase